MTPQEMYEYAEFYNKLEDLWIASYYNKAGFDHGQVFGDLVQKEDGIYVQLDDDDEEDAVKTCMSEEEFAKVQKEGYPVQIEILFIKEELVGVQLAVSDHGESEDEAYEEIRKAVLLGFIEFAGIDTAEKLEQVIREAWELMPEEIREDLEADRIDDWEELGEELWNEFFGEEE